MLSLGQAWWLVSETNEEGAGPRASSTAPHVNQTAFTARAPLDEQQQRGETAARVPRVGRGGPESLMPYSPTAREHQPSPELKG